MKQLMTHVLIGLASLAAFINTAHAEDILTGDTRLACEAIMCLVSGSRPDECQPSIDRYFSIRHKRLHKTINARRNFLEMCPSSDDTEEMTTLKETLVYAGDSCNTASLNTNLRTYYNEFDNTYISNELPSECSNYINHEYTDLGDLVPRYVGTPERGGHWVDTVDYDQALEAYNIRIAAEDEARRQAELESNWSSRY